MYTSAVHVYVDRPTHPQNERNSERERERGGEEGRETERGDRDR